MHSGTARIDEIYMQAGRAARLTCASKLVPAPGQYLLAHATSEPDSPLAHPVFMAASHSTGFYAAHPLPVAWTPGTELTLRGPLGRGFNLPASARKVALASFSSTCSRIMALLEPALAQSAAVALLTNTPLAGLPTALEILPLSALIETLRWAEYCAIDLPRAAVAEQLAPITNALLDGYTTEILIETPLPCGGVADCGVCAVPLRHGHALACKDGPVFDVRTLFRK